MAKYQCPDCAYIYDEEEGDDHQGYAPGTLFKDLPDDFVCPRCYVQEREDFIHLETKN